MLCGVAGPMECFCCVHMHSTIYTHFCGGLVRFANICVPHKYRNTVELRIRLILSDREIYLSDENRSNNLLPIK